jgi:hypothetical protein
VSEEQGCEQDEVLKSCSVNGSRPAPLVGDCSIDCLERCAYPGQFSECDQ